MTKLQQTIYITATEIEIGEKNQILVKTGEFYFQGKKYTIAEKQIKSVTLDENKLKENNYENSFSRYQR